MMMQSSIVGAPHSNPIVSAVPEVRIVRDPNDNMIVACAIAAGADYVVTRDKDMLSLDHYEGVGFATAEGFLKILRELSMAEQKPARGAE